MHNARVSHNQNCWLLFEYRPSPRPLEEMYSVGPVSIHSGDLKAKLSSYYNTNNKMEITNLPNVEIQMSLTQVVHNPLLTLFITIQ